MRVFMINSWVCRKPDEVVVKEVAAQRQGLQDVVSDLPQELGVLCEGLWVGVAISVCAKLQQNCWERGRKTNKQTIRRTETLVRKL